MVRKSTRRFDYLFPRQNAKLIEHQKTFQYKTQNIHTQAARQIFYPYSTLKI